MLYTTEYKIYLEKNGLKKELQVVNNVLGTLYTKQGSYTLAMKYYNQALHYYDSLNNSLKYARVLNNISILMEERGLSGYSEQTDPSFPL
jgi:tetratricopeptide (TPR) repeat protein